MFTKKHPLPPLVLPPTSLRTALAGSNSLPRRRTNRATAHPLIERLRATARHPHPSSHKG
ncbi:MAG: hypothetical protein GDA54_04095 [Alphaproteobacteria bacterium GM7ARS4]|nr:hypothetical protein [Alphaproteobacteria bacterium GM7ARS4]